MSVHYLLANRHWRDIEFCFARQNHKVARRWCILFQEKWPVNHQVLTGFDANVLQIGEENWSFDSWQRLLCVWANAWLALDSIVLPCLSVKEHRDRRVSILKRTGWGTPVKWGSDCLRVPSAMERTMGIRFFFFSFWWWCLFSRASRTFTLTLSSSSLDASWWSSTMSARVKWGGLVERNPTHLIFRVSVFNKCHWWMCTGHGAFSKWVKINELIIWQRIQVFVDSFAILHAVSRSLLHFLLWSSSNVHTCWVRKPSFLFPSSLLSQRHHALIIRLDQCGAHSKARQMCRAKCRWNQLVKL